ncbi:MFS transporter [Actinoalloteichus sp. AHMU CJ021]|uniref:MFS transporter n=2 Tax=Actinoalloteichus TaxID=65496 RepID=UPI000CA02B87|nr:MFS transporter [Actinoalloteichus sp. AHMU CJ021]
MTTTHTGPRAGRRQWLGLAVLALPTLLIAMDMTVLHLAVPALTADLAPTGTELLWITDSYGFLIAGTLITMGTLGDRIGRRRLLLIGSAAFGVASVLAAFSPTALTLILSRALLGVAGATLMPSTLSLIRTLFTHPRQRTLAVSVWMTCFAAGTALGPVVGGILLHQFWWGSVFLLGVPVMALLLATGPFLLPETRGERAAGLDLISVLLSLTAVLTAVYGIKHLAEHGPTGTSLVWLATGGVLGVVFVRRQRTLTHPLLDLGLFRNTTFTASLLAQTVTVFAMSGVMFFQGQYLQLVLGLSPLDAGLWMLPAVAAGVVGTLCAPLLVRWIRPAVLMAAGLTLGAAGLITLTWTDSDGGLPVLVAAFTAIQFGLGPTLTLTTDVILSSVPAQRVGSASALSETGSELGTALGIAVLGSVGTALYRGAMTDLPSGLGADAATAAGDTLGAAAALADALPAPLAGDLLSLARAAFTDAFHGVALIGTALTLAVAVTVVLTLRTPPTADTAADAA